MSRRRALTGAAAACVLLGLALAPAAQASFGVKSFEFFADSAPPAESEPGAVGPPDVQAGSHPFEVRTNFAFNLTTGPGGGTIPDGFVKDLRVDLPPGLIGSVNGLPQCPQEAFEQSFFYAQGCPADTQVGTLALETTSMKVTLPVFNLEPPEGVPVRLGVFAVLAPVIMDASVRTGGDYGLSVELRNLPQFLPLIAGSLTFWGVPADKAHDALRGTCLRSNGGSAGECPSAAPRRPFVTLPGACAGPPVTKISVDAWEAPGVPAVATAVPRDGEGNALSLSGCDRLDFSPSIEVEPEATTTPDAPTGLAVDVHVPQSEGPDGLASADLREAVLQLPPGVSIDTAAADGLGSCSEAEIGLDDAAASSCPDDSRIGAAAIDSPLLARPLEGSIYLAAPHANAFGSLLAIYVVARRDGILVKLPARIDADPVTGQLTVTLGGAPQLPFSDFTLTFDGGARAPLASPPGCGTFTTSARLSSYAQADGGAPSIASSAFTLARGCGGGFAPTFLAGATSVLAGRDTGFTLQLARSDGEQPIQSLTTTLPPGLLARLGGVPPCAAAEAAVGGCDAASRVGSIVIAAGAGSHPFDFTGQVFLTGPYGGAPFGLAIVIPAIAGPFDLGTVVVRAAISVDPQDAHLTIATDALPRILQGIPLRIRGIYLAVDRQAFLLDPTSCGHRQVSAMALADTGAQATLASPFAVGGCASLPFSPTLTAASVARVTRRGGAALDVSIANPPGTQANIREISVGFPKQLSPRLTAIQAACPQARFAVNPSSCPPASAVGSATLRTPILGVALRGPAYLVSGGRAGLPRVVLLLRGQGVELRILGTLRISATGATAVAFATVPDAPISSFELVLPRGSHSALGARFLGKAKGSLCGRSLTMPTTIVAQNGARLARSTRDVFAGCASRAARR